MTMGLMVAWYTVNALSVPLRETMTMGLMVAWYTVNALSVPLRETMTLLKPGRAITASPLSGRHRPVATRCSVSGRQSLHVECIHVSKLPTPPPVRGLAPKPMHGSGPWGATSRAREERGATLRRSARVSATSEIGPCQLIRRRNPGTYLRADAVDLHTSGPRFGFTPTTLM